MQRAIILPETWYEEATVFIARLNAHRPRYFLIPVPISFESDVKSYLPFVHEMMTKNKATSAMIVLSKSFASGDKIDSWPSLIQSDSGSNWVCSVFFADKWVEVKGALKDFSDEEYKRNTTHLTCQYDHIYTGILKLWEQEGGKPYHPGDYFKADILPEISQMKGNWMYWGHGEGDRLRGYNQLDIVDLLSNKCVTQLNATLWFTCSTLDRDYPENIALAWYQSGATKCLLASPDKVKTADNLVLSKTWLELAKRIGENTISSLILELIKSDQEDFERILSHYYLVGIPWVSTKV